MGRKLSFNGKDFDKVHDTIPTFSYIDFDKVLLFFLDLKYCHDTLMGRKLSFNGKDFDKVHDKILTFL
jgi:hypothetical protein